MNRLTDLIGKLEKYQDNTDSYLESATVDYKDTIIDMNISQMYEYGERRDGKDITPEYTPATIAIKKKKGQPTNRVTLRDTFNWQSSIWMQFYPDGFEIKADDWKTELLMEKYGDEILGLQDKMVKYLCEEVYFPRLITELKKILGYV